MRSNSLKFPPRLRLRSFQSQSLTISKSLNKKIRYSSKKICNGMSEYFQLSTVHGCNYVVEPQRSKIERYSWGILILIFLITTIWMVCYLYIDFLEAPTATSQVPTRKPVITVPFPGIGICDGNRISKRELTKLSTHLFNQQNRTYEKLGGSVEEVYDSLLYMGALYNIGSEEFNFNKLDRLHSFLSEVYNGTYSITNILTSLYNPCYNAIRNCKWQGQDVDCRRIFVERKTHIGLCCLFNYQRLRAEQVTLLHQNGTVIPDAIPIYIHGPGVELGLTVVIDHDVDDYAYFLNSNIANYIYVFEPLDFPDQESGALSERFLGAGQELFMSLHPQPVVGINAMRSIPSYSRGCLFYNEKYLPYNGYYSFTECNLNCQIDDLIKSCQCSPFNIPVVANTSECLLPDILCLKNWHDKWGNVETENINNRKKSVSYQCQQCLPTCTYNRYKIRASIGNIGAKIKSTNRHRLNLTALTSVLHVYFGDAYVMEYQQTIVHTWDELLSMFGGLFSLMMGASIISAFEYVYFQTGKFFTIFIKPKLKKSKKIEINAGILTIQTAEMEKDLDKVKKLYWNELKQDQQRKPNLKNNDTIY